MIGTPLFPPGVLPIDYSSNTDPRPPGFSPRWKKEGKYWVDPKTGTKWHYHSEDDIHWSHWDVFTPGKPKDRIPVDPEKGVFK